jgi:hypothetical protein
LILAIRTISITVISAKDKVIIGRIVVLARIALRV